MRQQFYTEERVRAEGDSGIKRVRHNRDGTRPYHTDTFAGSGVGSLHDHANWQDLAGQGEGTYVLNGVEFTTRHNDFMIHSKATGSGQYDATDEIENPDVPPSVLAKNSVQKQIDEMKKYFEAFLNKMPAFGQTTWTSFPQLSAIWKGRGLAQAMTLKSHFIVSATVLMQRRGVIWKTNGHSWLTAVANTTWRT
jgi:hypothetical protein